MPDRFPLLLATTSITEVFTVTKEQRLPWTIIRKSAVALGTSTFGIDTEAMFLSLSDSVGFHTDSTESQEQPQDCI